MPRIVVTINGTDVNPFAKWGMTHNPFPQLGTAETDHIERILARLDGEPIKDADDIRTRLKGCHPKFIEGCVQRYVPGERVRFELTWGTVVTLILRICEDTEDGLDETFGPFPDELARDRFAVMARDSGRYAKPVHYHYTTLEDPLSVAVAWALDANRRENAAPARTTYTDDETA